MSRICAHTDRIHDDRPAEPGEPWSGCYVDNVTLVSTP